MLEGAVMGAISGAVGAFGLHGAAGFLIEEGVDFTAGLLWDRYVRGQSWNEAVGGGVQNVLFGMGVRGIMGAGGSVFRALRGTDVDAPRLHGGQCPLNSFSADTEVSTPDGAVPIADIQEDDTVFGYNEATGEVGEYTVTATMQHDDATIVTLTIDGEQIETTPWHLFYTDTGWQEASDLSIGELVLGLDGDYGEVEAILIEERTETMYDLTVDEVHTFAVGDGAWVVHNVDTPAPRYMVDFGGWFKYRGPAWEYTQRGSLLASGRLPSWFNSWFVDKKGTRLPNISGRPPVNWRYHGGNYGFPQGSIQHILAPNGIDFDVMGFPILEPYAVAKVSLADMRGDRYHDFINANRELARSIGINPDDLDLTQKQWQYLHHETHGENFVWHHVQDEKTMLLLPAEIHDAVGHAGYEAIVNCK